MGKTNKKQMPMWAAAGHKAPVTRRDFLAAGLIPFAARMILPGGLGLLAPSLASAAGENCEAGKSSLIPFVRVHLRGGGAMASNYVPRPADRSALLNSYNTLGMGSGSGLTLEREFGLDAFAGGGISQMIVGFKSTGQAVTSDRTAFLAACVKSRDDSNDNKFDPDGMLFKAGLRGQWLPNLAKSEAGTLKGVAASVIAPTPLEISSYDDIINSIGYSQRVKNSMNANQQQSLARFLSRLSSSHARKLAAVSNANQVQNLIECAGIKNIGVLAAGPTTVTPTAGVLAAWGNPADGSQNKIFAAMTYNCMMGHSGSITIELGGYDYHTNRREDGQLADFQAGLVYRRILETARELNKPCFLLVTSDGAVGSPVTEQRIEAPWTSERGDAGMMYMFMYHPSGRPEVSDFQIGSFTQGQVVDSNHVIGNNPELATQAVFANYLSMNNRMDLFNTVIPRGGPLDPTLLASVIKVAPKPMMA